MSAYRLLSIDELAAKFGWSRDRVYRLVRASKIPHSRIGGRIYFQESTIDQWLASLESKPSVTESKPAPSLTHEEECRRLGIPVNHMFAS